MEQKKVNKKMNGLQITSIVIGIIFLIISIIFEVTLFTSNILPSKYFIASIIVLLLIIGITSFVILKKERKKIAYISSIIINIIISIILIIVTIIINNTMNFFKNISVRYNTDTYYILANKNSTYETIEDIKYQELNVFKDLDDMSKVEEKIKEKLQGNISYHSNVAELFDNVVNDLSYIIIVNSGNYDAITGIDEEYEDKVKIIDSIDITTEVSIEDVDVSTDKEPFVVYISGIDTRSNYMPSRSLSDVNIILAVNPKTKRLLMIHIPRDSYVYLHGIDTTLRDKLTHSGTVGGIELSKATIEDLLQIKIPYYVRVNFNSVMRLVDAIGGITINSDVDYSFKCNSVNAGKQCTIYPGLNEVDGSCALGFARERKAYETGDRHRGENQEQVIEKIIEKVSKSSTILNSYADILSSLEGTFETNINETDITNLIKMQIDDMATWKIEKSNITGTGAMMPTYCYPGRDLYVMNVDEQSINTAILKLNEVLEEN